MSTTSASATCSANSVNSFWLAVFAVIGRAGTDVTTQPVAASARLNAAPARPVPTTTHRPGDSFTG